MAADEDLCRIDSPPCPECGSRAGSRVRDSRLNPDEHRRRRRHRCVDCGEAWTTYEITASRLEQLEGYESLVMRIQREIPPRAA